MRFENKNTYPLSSIGIKSRYSNLDIGFYPRQTRTLFDIEVHPICSAPTEACGTFEIHNELSQFYMTTFLKETYTVEELYTFFFEPKDYAVYTMDATESALHKWNTLKTKLPSGNIKHIFIKSENSNSQHYIDFIKRFKEDNPKVNLFCGYVSTVESAERIYHAGADVIIANNTPYTLLSVDTIQEMFDIARVHNKKIGSAISEQHINVQIAMGMEYILTNIFAGFDESGGRVEVGESGTLKITDDSKSKYKGGVAQQIYHEVESIRKLMHYVGAKDLEHLERRVIFTV